MKKELKRSLVSKILLTLLAISILNLTACSPKALDLSGEWQQVEEGALGTGIQKAIIRSDTIEIYWAADGTDISALYWAGTYIAPTTANEPYSWESENDKSKTENALLASSDATKTFTYENGKISYSMSALGLTTTIYLERANSSEEANPSMQTVESNNPTSEVAETPKSLSTNAKIEETVLVDESGIKIIANALNYTQYSVDVDLTIENNTEKDLSFCCGTMGYSCNSVNGYMNTKVGAGKKAKEVISFSVRDLAMMGIIDIADIEIGFDIEDDFYDTYLQTGPRQIRTSIAESYDYSIDSYQEAIVSDALATEYGYLVNHHAKEEGYNQGGIHIVYITIGDISINGLSLQNGIWVSDAVNVGKHCITSINLTSILERTRNMFGIEEIGEISFAFGQKDTKYNQLIDPEDISISISDDASFNRAGTELYQADGIRIVAKGLVADSASYSDDIHLMLLVESEFDDSVSVDVDYNSVSVNGYMTDFLCFSNTVEPGHSMILDVELQDSSLDTNGISRTEDIAEIELTFKIRDSHYKTIANPVVTISY